MATTPVLKGDKENQNSAMNMRFNATCVADLIEPLASASGSSILSEVKVGTSLRLTGSAGLGSQKCGGKPSETVGHTVAEGGDCDAPG